CLTAVRATVPDRAAQRLDSAAPERARAFRRDATGVGFCPAQRDDGCTDEDCSTEEQAAIEHDERHAACVLDRQVITRPRMRQSFAPLFALILTITTPCVVRAATPLGVDLAVRVDPASAQLAGVERVALSVADGEHDVSLWVWADRIAVAP